MCHNNGQPSRSERTKAGRRWTLCNGTQSLFTVNCDCKAYSLSVPSSVQSALSNLFASRTTAIGVMGLRGLGCTTAIAVQTTQLSLCGREQAVRSDRALVPGKW